MFNFKTLGKCDQIAFYAHNKAQADAIKAMFGLANANWVEDFVSGDVTIWPLGVSDGLISNPLFSREPSRGHLQFNYDLGIEIEILTYLEGPNWHDCHTPQYAGGIPFLSHIGFHIPDDGEMPFNLGGKTALVQEMFTQRHTNEYVVSRGRKYHYKIFDTRNVNGVYTKLIHRIKSAKELAEEALAKAEHPAGKIAGAAKVLQSPSDVLAEAARLFESRNAIYGDGYLRFGAIAASLFPNGVTVSSAHDWTRLHLVMLEIIKMARYAECFNDGGHEDSPLDLSVYAAMLLSIDRNGAR